jgi:hypothetical protein
MNCNAQKIYAISNVEMAQITLEVSNKDGKISSPLCMSRYYIYEFRNACICAVALGLWHILYQVILPSGSFCGLYNV